MEMNMKNVEIISEEIITPSSPTPHHLRTLKLSFLDQIATPVYIPVILFYHHPSSDQIIGPSEVSSQLKKSLADTLTCYYPLAGTLRENSWIDCDDFGIKFLESRVTSCKLSEIVRNPNPKELIHFLPFEPYINETDGNEREVLLAVKANFFECGGLAIGVCVSHKIADGTSAFAFLNDWAATLRGDNDHKAVCQIIDAASYFRPKDLLGFKRDISKDSTEEKNVISTKRFVFDKSKINALKEEATGSQLKCPTRVEAVSAFIWQRIMAIARSKSPHQAKVFAAIHAVNLRPRMDPPLPTQSFGNLWWRIVIVPLIVDRSECEKTTKQDHDEYRSLVSQMRNAIKQVDSEYIKKLQSGGDDDGQMNMIKNMSVQFSRGEIELCNFTSWCRFPMYEVDFGWGKPAWVFSPIRQFKNLVMLMRTKDGDGIEAWVNLVEEDMALFERDAELLSFVSSSSPLGE